MSLDIIEQYKQAIAEKQGVPETSETPSLSVITETVKETADPQKEGDPFFSFVDTLSKVIEEKTKQEKKIAIEKQVQAAIEEATAGDGIEEKIKEAALSFIDKLKTPESVAKPLPDSLKKYTVKTLPKRKKATLQTVKKEKLDTKQEQEEVLTKTDNEKEDPYVKQLETADKSPTTKQAKAPLGDLKNLIKEQVSKQISEVTKNFHKMLGEAGGGGSVAKQFAKGGTMDGDLNVTGKYLSGGTDLSSIFGSGGGGAADRLISGSETLILNPDGSIDFPDNTIRAQNDTSIALESENTALSAFTRINLSPYAFFAYDANSNSITFDSVDNSIVLTTLDENYWTFDDTGKLSGPNNILTILGTISATNNIVALGKILSGGKDLSEIFLTAETDAQTLSWNSTAYELSISNGNTVSLSSLSATGGGGGGPTDRLINGSYQVVLSSNGDLALPGAIVTASNSKLDLVGFGPNTAYLTTTPDDSTALFMGANVAELRANTYVSITTNTGDTPRLWEFGADGSLKFPDNTTQTTAFTGNPDSSKWDNTYTTVQSNSSNWDTAYNAATVYQTNSASYATRNYVDTNFFPLSGGTISGPTIISSNLTVNGNLTALGTSTIANTIFTTTSALSVVNTGPGPALYVFQASGPYDVASFYDGDGIEVLHVGNAGPGGLGKVGINESFPNEELTVRGSISATETIYANSYLSAGVNLLDIFSGGGGGATPIKRFDYVTVSNVDYSYSGSALFETPDTSPTWKLIRLTYANNGTVSNSASALNSWTGRLTATYI